MSTAVSPSLSRMAPPVVQRLTEPQLAWLASVPSRASIRPTLMTDFGEPRFVYGAAEQAADGATGPVTASIVQLGTSAVSRAAQIVID